MEDLYAFLRCPADDGDLNLTERRQADAALRCCRCAQSYPIDDNGIVSFLGGAALPGLEDSAAAWDEESENYATGFARYTDTVEVAGTVRRLHGVGAPVLDHGAGTGRMTAELHRWTGQPVIAVDYSRENLRRLLQRCEGLPVLAVHADVRRLPVKSGVLGGVCSAGVYPLLPPQGRSELLAELARVLRPDASLVLSTLNYSWVFRLWRLRGNPGAREGRHLYGKNIYYRRQTRSELAAEMRHWFTIDEVVGVRNLPARTLVSLVETTLGPTASERSMDWLNRRGHRVDSAIERVALSRFTGFMLLAQARRRSPVSSPVPGR